MRIPALCSVACVVSLLGCSGDTLTKPEGVTSLAAIMPTGPAVAGERITLRVRVTSQGGAAAGVPVTWGASAGSLESTSISDAQGIASIEWTLPGVASNATAIASIGSAGQTRSVGFPLTVVPGRPALISTFPDTVSTRLNSCFQLRVTVMVADRFGNFIAHPDVSWSVVDGPIAASSGKGQTETTRVFATTGSPGTGHVRAAIETGEFVDVTLGVLAPRNEVVFAEDPWYGEVFFQSAQNCSGYNNTAVDTVAVGQEITWRNAKATPMRLVPAGTTFPSSPVVGPWGEYTVMFTVPGTYKYTDVSATGVVGTVVVK